MRAPMTTTMRAPMTTTMRLPRSKAHASSTSNSSKATALSSSTSANRSSPSSLRLLPSSSPSSRKQQQLRPLSKPPRSTPDEELEAQMEAFLKKQAEIEGSGSVGATATATVEQVADEAEKAGARAGPGGDEGAILGADVVSDDESKRLCREVVEYVQTLRSSREMTVNEIRLTLAIESPLVREQRELLGVERGAGGVSRDDVAAALAAVAAGRVPRDRLALKELHRELRDWPFLRDAASGGGGGGAASTSGKTEEGISGNSLARRARYEGSVGGERGSAPSGWRQGQARPRMLGRDPTEEPQNLADRLPEWMGYGALYAISAIPVLIAGSVIAILFFNSLK